jgi:ArsR family transcriptional regulator
MYSTPCSGDTGEGGTVTIERTETEILCCPPLAEHALSEEEATRLAGVLAALADPVRLRIFSIIASQDETCSCNLEGPLGRSQPTISHHTHKLASAGLIIGDKRGRWTWWRAVPEQVAALGAVLGTGG